MTSQKPVLLGVAASLRNARWGAGKRNLVERLKSITNEDDLFEYLEAESTLLLERTIEAGRAEGKSFLEISANLKKSTGESGLSNSETALASALWAAAQHGVDIAHLSLPEYFTAKGEFRNIDELRAALMAADGLLISGPVYFGDRGSLAESLIRFIRSDQELLTNLRNKPYGGIAVGAKRNGGQETTLIYQMNDMLNVGMLALGNDSDTTSQYGGTGHAGDVGSMHKDKYGLSTSMGTGRRMADVMTLVQNESALKDKLRVLVVILQENAGYAEQAVAKLKSDFSEEIEITTINVCDQSVMRCIACDICPTHISDDEEYRCIIKSNNDALKNLHEELLHHDVIVPVAVSMKDTSSEVSNYQVFIERTRYLRRGDYVFSNCLVIPYVLEEVGGQSHLGMRMMTSFIRHHTVMSKVAYGALHGGEIINSDDVNDAFRSGFEAAKKITSGRLKHTATMQELKYHPVGYVLSAAKDQEDDELKAREKMIAGRTARVIEEAKVRLRQG